LLRVDVRGFDFFCALPLFLIAFFPPPFFPCVAFFAPSSPLCELQRKECVLRFVSCRLLLPVFALPSPLCGCLRFYRLFYTPAWSVFGESSFCRTRWRLSFFLPADKGCCLFCFPFFLFMLSSFRFPPDVATALNAAFEEGPPALLLKFFSVSLTFRFSSFFGFLVPCVVWRLVSCPSRAFFHRGFFPPCFPVLWIFPCSIPPPCLLPK